MIIDIAMPQNLFEQWLTCILVTTDQIGNDHMVLLVLDAQSGSRHGNLAPPLAIGNDVVLTLQNTPGPDHQLARRDPVGVNHRPEDSIPEFKR